MLEAGRRGVFFKVVRGGSRVAVVQIKTSKYVGVEQSAFSLRTEFATRHIFQIA